MRRVLIAAVALVLAACGGSGVDLAELGGEEVPADLGGPADGRTFTDPQNRYRIVIDPDWTYDTAAGDGIAELWFVEPVAFGEFGANVNVVVQDIGNMSLDTYIRASLLTLEDSIASPEVVANTTITAPDGDDLARIEYTGEVLGRSLRFLQYVDVDDGSAAIATFTAPRDAFGGLVTQVEPYLATVALR